MIQCMWPFQLYTEWPARPSAGSLGRHGSINPEHLQAYLEEFTFRFNRRTSRSRGLIFRRLLEQTVATLPTTEKSVINGKHWKP